MNRLSLAQARMRLRQQATRLDTGTAAAPHARLQARSRITCCKLRLGAALAARHTCLPRLPLHRLTTRITRC